MVYVEITLLQSMDAARTVIGIMTDQLYPMGSLHLAMDVRICC